MPRLLGLSEYTLFAELLDRSLDAMFDDPFPENGSFVTRTRTNREEVSRGYWYDQGYRTGPAATDDALKRYALYVGPTDDPVIRDRVRRFAEIKKARSDRGRLVDALAGAGMPRPPATIGRVVEALAKAGEFRLRAVLVGTAAYQTYGGLIGVRPTLAFAITGDVDVAQFRSVSICVADSVSDMMAVLCEVDPSSKPLPGLNDKAGRWCSRMPPGSGWMSSPHRRSDDQMGSPLAMLALGAAAAQPLRFLDDLLHRPVRAVVLHGSGISVQVPAPERYALHKLIVADRWHTTGQSGQGPQRRPVGGGVPRSARHGGAPTCRGAGLRGGLGAGSDMEGSHRARGGEAPRLDPSGDRRPGAAVRASSLTASQAGSATMSDTPSLASPEERFGGLASAEQSLSASPSSYRSMIHISAFPRSETRCHQRSAPAVPGMTVTRWRENGMA